MRALWFISTIFLLYGCGDIQTPSLQSTSSENKEVATFKLESIVEHRASRSFSLKWSGNTIPAWQKYTFCLNNAEKLNNCHVVKEGGNSANSTSLKLSVDISLEQLLMALKTPPFLLLYAEDKVVIDTYQLSIEQEQINKTIQYLKRLMRK